MSGSQASCPIARAKDPFEEALVALLAEWEASGKCSSSDKALILALAKKISPIRRSDLLQNVKEELISPSPRGGPVFENVVRLFDERPEWTAASLQRKLIAKGVPVDAKTMSNCLNYLARSGRLVRVSRGRYAAPGFGVIASGDEHPLHDISKGGENED